MARLLEGAERKGIDRQITTGSAELFAQSPEVGGGSCSVYRIEGHLYAALYLDGWLDEISEIEENEVPHFIGG